jgi:glycylpeptide N-tetradecanoyltransferase
MMRRKRKNGFAQAYYTSGHSMPTPFSTATFMNRFINVEKLCQIKYTSKPNATMPMAEFAKQHRLPKKETIKIEGEIRQMEKKDISTVLKLFNMQ